MFQWFKGPESSQAVELNNRNNRTNNYNSIIGDDLPNTNSPPQTPDNTNNTILNIIKRDTISTIKKLFQSDNSIDDDNGHNNGDDLILSPARPNSRSWLTNSNINNKFNRLVDRDGPFHQSKGIWSIRKRMYTNAWRSLYAGDWFHSLVDSPTLRVVGILIAGYLIMIIIFAYLYLLISKYYGCNMGLQNFRESFVFSLETMATIGYGTQDIFFDDCIIPIIVLTIQVCMKLVADAVTIGVIYCRLARPQGRASTILFSCNAIIRRVRGKLYFMLQLCELRKHQLVSAHVRLYCIRNNILNDESIQNNNNNNKNKKNYTNFQTCHMRLNHPNDELGGMLLLCLPQTIVHEIDICSPLMPPPKWYSCEESKTYEWTPYVNNNNNNNKEFTDFPDINTRSNNNNDFKKYQSSGLNEYNNIMNNITSSPIISSTTNDEKFDWQIDEQEMIQKYMKDRKIEIITIVEGIDAATGGSVQAMHSFTLNEIIWNKGFVPCVFEDEDNCAIIDFSLFHEIEDVSLDAAFVENIQSCN
jgi:potassium inwardly-rectifying channel subfamily J